MHYHFIIAESDMQLFSNYALPTNQDTLHIGMIPISVTELDTIGRPFDSDSYPYRVYFIAMNGVMGITHINYTEEITSFTPINDSERLMALIGVASQGILSYLQSMSDDEEFDDDEIINMIDECSTPMNIGYLSASSGLSPLRTPELSPIPQNVELQPSYVPMSTPSPLLFSSSLIRDDAPAAEQMSPPPLRRSSP